MKPFNFFQFFLKLFLVAFSLLFLCLSPAVFAESNSEKQSFKVYEAVPEGRSLLTSPQFILIDDFNSGKFLNRRGASWRTRGPNESVELSLDKDDARSQHRGYSMRANFHLLPREKARVESFLERVDVSQAQYLVMKMKLGSSKEKVFSGRLRVSLTDWKHKTVTQDVTALCPPNGDGWRNVLIPMSRFKLLDLDQLFSIAFEIKAGTKEIFGDVWMDEIAFFGFNDVFFESLRDNLKGFPKVVFDSNRKNQLLKMKDAELLKALARDTWKYFENARDKDTGLVVDHIRTGDSSLAADYTSPTNIAMDLIATVAAMDLGFLSKNQAEERVLGTFKTLEDMRRYKGFFYNFYDTKKLSVTREYISSVDSGWIAVAFVVLRQAFPGKIAEQATEFIKSFSFNEFLDPETNQLMIGIELPYKADRDVHHYGMLVSEARIASFYAIGKGDIPRNHWWSLFRTPPDAWTWQTQTPKGIEKETPDGKANYFQGYYDYKGKKFVPSWGGSLFEFLMPTLVLDEPALAPKGLGLNDRRAVEIQRDYALADKKYPVWGISPAATSDGRRWSYREYGIKAMSAKGYPDAGVVTPHVTFLALNILPKDAISNIRRLLELAIYGEYGLYDSYDLKQQKANPQYLALDQGMTLIALTNYLQKGSIQKRFQKDEITQKALDLLKEDFFEK